LSPSLPRASPSLSTAPWTCFIVTLFAIPVGARVRRLAARPAQGADPQGGKKVQMLG